MKKEIINWLLSLIISILLVCLVFNGCAQSPIKIEPTTMLKDIVTLQITKADSSFMTGIVVDYPERKPIKIGILEIPYREADEYFKDCLTHADTIEMHYYGFSMMSSLSKESTPRIQIRYEDKQYNDDLKRKSIREYVEHGLTYYIIPRQPSEIDYIKWKYSK